MLLGQTALKRLISLHCIGKNTGLRNSFEQENSSRCFKKINIFIKLLFLCDRADEWVSAAVDCLEYLPDQIVVDVSRNLPECRDKDRSWKLLLFETISKHYNQNRVPLVTNPFFDIHSGIAELLGTFLETKTLKLFALQNPSWSEPAPLSSLVR